MSEDDAGDAMADALREAGVRRIEPAPAPAYPVEFPPAEAGAAVGQDSTRWVRLRLARPAAALGRIPRRWRGWAARLVALSVVLVLPAIDIRFAVVEFCVGFLALFYALSWWRTRSLPARTGRALQGLLGLGTMPSRPLRWRRLQRGQAEVEFVYRMPLGVDIAKVEAARPALEQHMDVRARIFHRNGRTHIILGRHPVPDEVRYLDFYGGQQRPPEGELVVGVGVGRSGPLWLDLASDSSAHLIVGGAPGKGKSSLLRQMLVRLLTAEPGRVQLALIDLKGGIEFAHLFDDIPELLPDRRRNRPGRVASELPDAVGLLAQVGDELQARMALLRAAGVTSLAALNAKRLPGERIPYLLVVIDEMAQFIPEDTTDQDERKLRQAALNGISEVVRLGRACGVFAICCTQRPDVKAIPGQVQSSVAVRIAFWVPSPLSSRILLDENHGDAALLPPFPGRAIVKLGHLTEVQTIHLSADEASRLLGRGMVQVVQTAPA